MLTASEEAFYHFFTQHIPQDRLTDEESFRAMSKAIFRDSCFRSRVFCGEGMVLNSITAYVSDDSDAAADKKTVLLRLK